MNTPFQGVGKERVLKFFDLDRIMGDLMARYEF